MSRMNHTHHVVVAVEPEDFLPLQLDMNKV